MEPDPRLHDQIGRFEEQLEANPDSLVFARLADLHRKAGDPGRGLEVLRRGLDRHPDYASGHIVRGRCLRDEGREEEAREAFERVLELDGQNLVALRALAEMARERGDREEARRRLEALLQVDPGNEPAREMLDELTGQEPPQGGADTGTGETGPEVDAVEDPGTPPVEDEPVDDEPVDEPAGWADGDDFFDDAPEDDAGTAEDTGAGDDGDEVVGFDEIELPGPGAEAGGEAAGPEGGGSEEVRDDGGIDLPDPSDGPDGGLDGEEPGPAAGPGESEPAGPEPAWDGETSELSEPELPESDLPEPELPEPDEVEEVEEPERDAGEPGPGEPDPETAEAEPEDGSSWWQSFFPGGEGSGAVDEEPEGADGDGGPPSGEFPGTEEPTPEEPTPEEPATEEGPEEEEAWDEILAAGADGDTAAGEDAAVGNDAAAGDEEAPAQDEASSPAFGEADADELRARIEELGRDIEGDADAGEGEGDLATETLAGLYEAQGFHRQAVEMYEDLVERRPEDEELRRRLERAREALEAAEEAGAGEETGPADDPSEAVAEAGPPNTARGQLRALLQGEARPGGGDGEP